MPTFSPNTSNQNFEISIFFSVVDFQIEHTHTRKNTHTQKHTRRDKTHANTKHRHKNTHTNIITHTHKTERNAKS
jgi:hypothetical protein